jgi:hypothetical protein
LWATSLEGTEEESGMMLLAMSLKNIESRLEQEDWKLRRWGWC